MQEQLKAAFVAGYERLLAWTDLLDQINVFPVADSDTGQNLKTTLLPLGRMDRPVEDLARDLLLGATGNSGNIAAAFFSQVLKTETVVDLSRTVENGSCRARQSVADPKPGSMLTVYDELTKALEETLPCNWPGGVAGVIDKLAASVAATTSQLSELQAAGVVDAGALGMFIFMEAFLARIAGVDNHFCDIPAYFNGRLRIRKLSPESTAEGVCVSTLVRPQDNTDFRSDDLASWAESVVVGTQDELVKVHLHTRKPEALREHMASMGEVLQWRQEKIEPSALPLAGEDAAVHIMTDAAGSMTREDARRLGVTLLDSCIVMDGRKYPETLLDHQKVYAAMVDGVRVGTAQTSLFQRHQAYQSAVSRYAKVLYICVGSVYTGNFDSARRFGASHDPQKRLFVLDSGAASGRLGVIARQTALFAKENSSVDAVCDYARQAMDASREYVFLDQLKYLVAGGRLSRTSGFFGDLLGLKPVITPRPQGAVKAGTVRSRRGQLDFAMQKLSAAFAGEDAPLILLQFSDNIDWVRRTVVPPVKALLPNAEVVLRPLSLTSGVHMGPGTWSLAYLSRQLRLNAEDGT